MCHPHF